QGKRLPSFEELRAHESKPEMGSGVLESGRRWPSVEAFDSRFANSESADGPRVETVEETITRVEEHRLKKRIRDLESERNDLARQLAEGGDYHAVIAEVLAHQHEAPPPRIAPRERTS